VCVCVVFWLVYVVQKMISLFVNECHASIGHPNLAYYSPKRYVTCVYVCVLLSPRFVYVCVRASLSFCLNCACVCVCMCARVYGSV